ncbi:MAG: cupin domain-containing protein [Deltaproteobacteria bacterium]
MKTLFYPKDEISFVDHPKYANVKIAKLVTNQDTETISVSQLEIEPGTEIPIHTHDPQVDSIFVLAGTGEAFINGQWQGITAGDYIFVPALEPHGVRNSGSEILRLFIVHCPPLF